MEDKELKNEINLHKKNFQTEINSFYNIPHMMFKKAWREENEPYPFYKSNPFFNDLKWSPKTPDFYIDDKERTITITPSNLIGDLQTDYVFHFKPMNLGRLKITQEIYDRSKGDLKDNSTLVSQKSIQIPQGIDILYADVINDWHNGNSIDTYKLEDKKAKMKKGRKFTFKSTKEHNVYRNISPRVTEKLSEKEGDLFFEFQDYYKNIIRNIAVAVGTLATEKISNNQEWNLEEEYKKLADDFNVKLATEVKSREKLILQMNSNLNPYFIKTWYGSPTFIGTDSRVFSNYGYISVEEPFTISIRTLTEPVMTENQVDKSISLQGELRLKEYPNRVISATGVPKYRFEMFYVIYADNEDTEYSDSEPLLLSKNLEPVDINSVKKIVNEFLEIIKAHSKPNVEYMRQMKKGIGQRRDKIKIEADEERLKKFISKIKKQDIKNKKDGYEYPFLKENFNLSEMGTTAYINTIYAEFQKNLKMFFDYGKKGTGKNTKYDFYFYVIQSPYSEDFNLTKRYIGISPILNDQSKKSIVISPLIIGELDIAYAPITTFNQIDNMIWYSDNTNSWGQKTVGVKNWITEFFRDPNPIKYIGRFGIDFKLSDDFSLEIDTLNQRQSQRYVPTEDYLETDTFNFKKLTTVSTNGFENYSDLFRQSYSTICKRIKGVHPFEMFYPYKGVYDPKRGLMPHDENLPKVIALLPNMFNDREKLNDNYYFSQTNGHYILLIQANYNISFKADETFKIITTDINENTQTLYDTNFLIDSIKNDNNVAVTEDEMYIQQERFVNEENFFPIYSTNTRGFVFSHKVNEKDRYGKIYPLTTRAVHHQREKRGANYQYKVSKIFVELVFDEIYKTCIREGYTTLPSFTPKYNREEFKVYKKGILQYQNNNKNSMESPNPIPYDLFFGNNNVFGMRIRKFSELLDEDYKRSGGSVASSLKVSLAKLYDISKYRLEPQGDIRLYYDDISDEMIIFLSGKDNTIGSNSYLYFNPRYFYTAFQFIDNMNNGSGTLYAYGDPSDNWSAMLFSPTSSFDEYDSPQIILMVGSLRG